MLYGVLLYGVSSLVCSHQVTVVSLLLPRLFRCSCFGSNERSESSQVGYILMYHMVDEDEEEDEEEEEEEGEAG